MRIVLLVLCIVTIIQALDRPPTPTINGVTFNAATKQLTISGAMSGADSCHAVLLTDLTTGFDAAYATANTKSNSGSIVSYAYRTMPLVINLADNFRERYFVAVASSKKDADSISVFSPWRVFANNDGVPIAVSTNSDNTPENVFYRARRIDESNDSIVVADIAVSGI